MCPVSVAPSEMDEPSFIVGWMVYLRSSVEWDLVGSRPGRVAT